MKEADYFRQAMNDPAFRAVQLDSLRYQRKVSGWCLLGLIVLAGVLYLVSGLIEHRWKLDLSVWPMIVLMCWVYAANKTRIAALEVMGDQKSVGLSGSSAAPVATRG